MARTSLMRQIRSMMKAAQRANALKLTDSQLREKFEEDRERLINRRHFIQKSAVMALAAAPVANFVREQIFAAQPVTGSYSANDRVAIIGAGAAGLAAAYQLAKAKIPFDLFEGSNRTGGRIFTLSDFNANGQFIELGAELVDSDHEALIGLAKEVLGEDSIQDFAGPDALEDDMFYFGGQLRSKLDFVAALRPFLEQVEKDHSEAYQGVDADTDVTVDWPGSDKIKEIDQLSLAEYLKKYSALMDPWVKDALIVAYTGDMGLEVDQQSALSILTAIDTDPDTDGFYLFGGDESKRVSGGNMRLIEALYYKIFDKNPLATFHSEHNLMGIRQNDAASQFVLAFRNGAQVRASQVILAIPGTILREVRGLDGLELDPLIKRQIAELNFGTNTKIMMSYKNRFWREGLNGRPKNEGALYLDLGSQNFWETSRKQIGAQGVLTNFLGGKAGLNADAASVAKAQSDLAAVYGDKNNEISDQMDRSIVWNWNTKPFVKASYSCPGPGQYTGIWGRMDKPQLGGRLFFAGEHTSSSYWGFMNGGYESGLRAGQQVVEARSGTRAVK